MAVYDDQKTENLNDLTGIDPRAEHKMDADAERGALEDIADRENLYNPRGDSSDGAAKAAGSSELGAAETAAGDSGGSLYNSNKDATPNFRQKLKGGAGKLLKNKWAMGAGVAGGGGSIIIILLLIVLAGSLKIPNLAQNITIYEFARLTRQFSRSAERVTAQSMAQQASDNGTYSSLKAKYASATGKASASFAKLDKFRPSKVAEKFKTNNGFATRYEDTGFLGRSRLAGITLNGVDYELKQPTGVVQNLPGIKSFVKLKNQAAFSRTYAPALKDAMLTTEAGPLVRGVVAKNIRQELGISLTAWTLAKLKGMTPEEVRVETNRQRATAVDEKTKLNVEKAATASNAEAEEKARIAQKTALEAADGKELSAAIKSNGVLASVKNAIGSAVENTPLKTSVEILNPIYAVALPICIVYDGSMDKAGPTIDNQTTQQQATYYYIASAADQQKNGNMSNGDAKPLAMAVGALNDDLGDTSKTNAQIRAGGGAVSTASTISAEASATGDFTLLNASGLDPGVADTINKVATPLCGALTNVYLAGALGVANILVALIPGLNVAGGVGEGAVVAAGESVSRVIINRVAEKLLGQFGTKLVTGASRTSAFVYDVGKSALTIAGITTVAKLVVAARAGQLNSGMAQGTDLANQADAGGNVAAGEIGRRGQFGRALNQTELAKSGQSDARFIAAQNQKNSAFDRYFAPSNANSMLSHVALSLSANANSGILNNMLRLAGSILQPMKSLGSVLSPLMGSRALADPTNSSYGNVQFGWSEDEEKLIDSNSSYRMLDNQKFLDDSGKEKTIAAEYAVCFGYLYDDSGNGSYDVADPASNMKPNEEGTLGGLLSRGDITRDKDGNVVNNDKKCSPSSLGPSNSTYQDLVFRWRLAMSYNNTLDQLTSIQDPAEDTSAASAPTTAPATGTIVGNIGESSTDVPCAANTKDLGTVLSKYSGTLKQGSGPLTIRLCQLSSIGGVGDNTQGGSVSGGAVLNSRVAGAWQALGEKAKAGKVALSASSSFRLNDSCGGTGNGSACAKPGQSLHQLGVAIDFATITVKGTSTTSCSGRGTQPGNAAWDWLNNNAAQFGFKQYSFEAWHWDSLNTVNRCGGDGTI